MDGMDQKEYYLITNRMNDNQPNLVCVDIIDCMIGGFETYVREIIPYNYKDTFYIDHWANDLSIVYVRDSYSDRVLMKIEKVLL